MKKKIFLSDFHFGVPNSENSLEREKKICSFLKSLANELSDIYFVGDVFDFWFEYKTCVPKGYYRFFGTVAELADSGIQIHFFTGNHDMWMRDFFTKEFNAKIYTKPITIQIGSKKLYVGHGDGLGPGDKKYKFLKLFFSSPLCQFLFKWIHPDIGIALANFFSLRSRYNQPKDLKNYLGHKNEWLYIFSRNMLKDTMIDYFIFGHRHLPIYTKIDHFSSIYINLGDWLEYNTFAIFDGNDVSLQQFGSDKNNFDFCPYKHI